MKKIISIFSCWFFLLSLNASSIDGKVFVRGSYIDNQHQIFSGTLEIPTEYLNKVLIKEYLYWKVLFIDDNGNPKVLTPYSIQSYQFEYKAKQYEFVSMINQLGLSNPFDDSDDKLFVERKVKGAIQLLKVCMYDVDSGIYYETGGGDGSGTSGDIFTNDQLFIKQNGQLIPIRRIAWKKQFKVLFKDQPELLQWIEENKLRRRDIPKIIVEANKERWRI